MSYMVRKVKSLEEIKKIQLERKYLACFSPEMEKYCGKVIKLREVPYYSSYDYEIVGISELWFFIEEWLEPLTELEKVLYE